MVNALPRAHVDEVKPVAASVEDLSVETLRAAEESEQEEIEDAPRLSRKEKRKAKKQRIVREHSAPAASEQIIPQTPDESEEWTDTSQPRSRKEKRKARKLAPTSTPSGLPTPPPSTSASPSPPAITKSLSPAMPPNPLPLLICSLGNPGPQYANTLHSAGHTVLKTIQTRAGFRPFTPSLSGLVSRPDTTSRTLSWTGIIKKEGQNRELMPHEDDFTLWQSTSLMNISGANVKKAWAKFASDQRAKGVEGRLVIVHDELEADLGKISVKAGTASPRGHNGLKSVQAALGTNVKWWRVGVGIGRPESRDASVVSKYVLRKMTAREEAVMEKAAAGVQKVLRDIAEEKY
ncbi:peptidyl-tRNA hydrolase [Amniculicola lignicola CBS 123094]|uniref:peptidyl-tRNA hydrolase n=1 Tax=Amniculicola lignicola CBS 123094 TaxID=1392246 RepID=A0A6A5WMP6_9PLEO|nr:peptidyl-tRNA hydrolase [Amniculicola lignicola CBS 123094]